MSARDELDRMAALAEGATRGPWVADQFDVYEAGTDLGDVVAECGLHPRDARFIAAAREDWPRTVKALNAALAVHAKHEAPLVRTGGTNKCRCVACDMARAIEAVLGGDPR